MSIFTRAFVIVALSLIQQCVYATTYYIDSQFGNDFWSGKLPTAISSPSPDGPWQSLDRLASAPLSPGDVVELRCGSKWAQTLRVKNSGTPQLPIIIRSSSPCNIPPSIDGSQGIDAYSWVRHNGNIYKSSWPNQKIQNGSLASGVAGWGSWSVGGDQKLIYENNCPGSSSGCAAFTPSVKPGGSLVNSNPFRVESGVLYSGGISLQIPAGIKVKVLVRRGSPPYESISAVQWLTGTGAWQKFSMAFTPRYAVQDARLDMEDSPEGVTFRFKDASITGTSSVPSGAWIADLPLLPAYHPNRGHDISQPSSVYARVAADANTTPLANGVTGSSYLDIDDTLKLPSGVLPKPGNRLRIRSAPWQIDEATITQVVGTRLYFAPSTSYQVRAGQGYFLLGGLEMLDAPGEWIYDAATGSTYTWMPDGNAPSDRVRLSILEKGVDLSGRSDITVDGIDIQYTGLGADLTGARNVTLNSVKLSKIMREGILAYGSTNINITASQLYKTGRDAISANGASALNVRDNDITESAVNLNADLVWTLPAPTTAAIFTGPSATVTGNRIRYSASNGTWVFNNGTVDHNAVLDSCLQINDCAGIVVNYSSPGTRIASNLIERVQSDVAGVVPSLALPHGVGIYLDDLSTNMVVESNTVAWADFGIQLHNAHNNQVIKNLLYGNRSTQLYFHQDSNKNASTGDIYSNELSNNHFFSTKPAAAVVFRGDIGSLTGFGILSDNYYSGLLGKRIVSESWAAHSLTYTLEEWQSASGDGRVPQDIGSLQRVQDGYAIYLVAGSNIVPNGGLQAGMTGWSSWNETAPFSTRTYESCAFAPCLRITAGGSSTLASTPNFSVEAGRSYRVSFDARTDTAGQPISPVVRRGGPPPLYERLMPASEGFASSMEWRRYGFIFTAAKTVAAGDPVTGDLGARLDFENILPGQTLWIANMEIVPLLPVENTLRTQLITNPGRTIQSSECPDQETAPEFCERYHVFPEGTPVSWPIDLPPLGAISIYTINNAARDSDGDGIADSADICPDTLKTEQVNASGCGLTQIPGK